ncbi:hypothetical protein SAMN06297387_12856 [Streptomyces zhaozhouensis]|uniref:Uncharacterized protein n=1 Tax=Streptomyces zhaozhouensis TaxID=1300267 RepID=A0A286E849_9ACTN|nr:hypothetical protein [Streptomyces zhaozhouensis]SOD67082.1 hypothetical protein SAMN06297387_12856 [Streptomyces zhaozhouensis]
MATTHPQAAATAAATTLTSVTEVDLETRLAAVDASMTVRLEAALLRLDIDAAAPETTIPFEDADTEALSAYVARTQPPPTPTYRTPVAALLERAAHRIDRDGWCRDATRDAAGARCLYGGIAIEAATASEEDAALKLLLETIQRHDPSTRTIPSHNASLRSGANAVQLLTKAAQLAHARSQ